ncbi:MAG: NAD/NADP octopine/nopaline dehydrogenase family protein, partial [Desulfobacterales bacterium]|nr:NAD/NADP octopine/nopaline dehydrogenase family protein [Desulfobacterales bacterium]
MAIITVIGAGNGAHALAADCKLGGAQVRMYEFTRFNNKVKGILNSRRICFEGIEMNHENFKRNGTAVIDMVTYDMKEAVHGANHILVSAQAQGFEQIFEELAPLLEDGQTVSIFPDNYGSLILRRIMREKGLNTKVIIAGYSSLVYGARLTDFNNMETETDVVNVMYRENEIRVDTLPSSDFDTYLSASKEIPALDATTLIQGDTVLDIGLSNVNVLLHVPAVVLNTGTIENWGIIPNVGTKDAVYDIYAHGVSPCVGRVQYAFYQEQVAIANAFGVGICPVDEDVLQSRMGLIGQMMYGEDYRLPFSEPLDQTTWLPAPKGTR